MAGAEANLIKERGGSSLRRSIEFCMQDVYAVIAVFVKHRRSTAKRIADEFMQAIDQAIERLMR